MRRLQSELGSDRETASALTILAKDTFKGLVSGYTRSIPLPRRKGDLAEIVRMEWTVKPEKVEAKPVKKEKKTKVVKAKVVKKTDKKESAPKKDAKKSK